MVGKENGLDGAPFVVKTYQLVSDPSTMHLVCWSATKDSFVVLKPVEFAHEVLPKYFKHNNFCSFIRQLNTYGFHKVESKQWEFKHEFFREGETGLLKDIARRKSKKREASDPPATPDEFEAPKTDDRPQPAASPAPFTFINDEDEVEKLKGINNLLMKEVIRLQQQQETTQGTIKQILDELIESRKEQQALQNKVEILAQEWHQKSPTSNKSPRVQGVVASFPPVSNFRPPLPSDDASLLGLDDLAHLELASQGLEFNMANLLHITPPSSPLHQPPSPYNSLGSLPSSPQIPLSPSLVLAAQQLPNSPQQPPNSPQYNL